jgi:hypothetical protein
VPEPPRGQAEVRAKMHSFRDIPHPGIPGLTIAPHHAALGWRRQ